MSLIVVGAGGFGREVMSYALDQGLEVRGFLDRRADALARFGIDTPVIGDASAHEPLPDCEYIVAVGDPALRHELASLLEARGARFATIRHHTAHVAPRVRMGPGCIVGPFAFIGPDCEIGAHVVFNTYASAGHDAVIGRASVLSPYAVVNGGVILEDQVMLATQSAVVPLKRVGRGSTVGAGAIVTRDIEPGSLALGIPARARPLAGT